MPKRRSILGIKIPQAVFRNLFRLNLLLLLVIFCTTLGLRLFLRPRALPATATTDGYEHLKKSGGEILGLWEIDISMGRSLLHQGIPLLKVRNNPQTLYQRPRGFFRVLADLIFMVDPAYPKTLLELSIPSAKRIWRQAGGIHHPGTISRPLIPRSQPGVDTTEEKRRRWQEHPLVGIYHTHTSESYLPDTGKAWTEGEPGGITRIGRELAQTLWEEYGIAVVHNQTIHDWPVWRLSYANSLETGEEMVKKFPSLTMLLDLHRDAAGNNDPIQCLTKINGEDIARILMVVGSDQPGLAHPQWEKNLEFARLLHEKMEALYPGLSRGVRLREDGRWNQHLHPQALLLEVGEVNSTEEQCKAAVRRLAHVICEILKDQHF